MKNTTHYSAKDIQRYLKGEMSAREMFQLEKAALEDPFLADAIEGFESHPSGTNDLQELHARLNARVSASGKVRRIIPLLAASTGWSRTSWVRIAAAVLLLVGLGISAWYFLLNTKNTGQPTIATNRAAAAHPSAPAAIAADSARTAAPPPAASNTQPSAAINPAPPSTEKEIVATEPALKKARISEAPKPTLPEGTPGISADSIQLKSLQTTSGLADEEKSALPAAAARARELSAFRKDTVLAETNNFPATYIAPPLKAISGRVLDFHNNPLPGVTVLLAGNNDVATVTDKQGNFRLSIDPKAANKDSVLHVNVRMVGYQPSSLAFNALDPRAANGNLIYLKPESGSLDEVIVSRYSTKRRETRAMLPSSDNEKVDSLWTSAMPVSGRQAFLDYLDSGKATIGADTTIHGTVVVSFDVSKKGELSSFKVERSLTPAHDAGVIRLISEGPHWKVSKNHSVRCAVRVTF